MYSYSSGYLKMQFVAVGTDVEKAGAEARFFAWQTKSFPLILAGNINKIAGSTMSPGNHEMIRFERLSSLNGLPINEPGYWGHNGYVSGSVFEVTSRSAGEGASFELKLLPLPSVFRKDWTITEEDWEEYATLIAEGYSFAAYDGTRVAGMIICAAQQWNNTLHIENLLVASQYRKKGIGGALINRVIKEASQSKFRQVTLETQNTNVPAVAFYRKQGFRIDGLRLGLYDPSENPGEIAIFMAYRIG